MRSLFLPDGQLRNKANFISQTISNLIYEGVVFLDGFCVARWPADYWTNRQAYPSDFNPKNNAALKASQRIADGNDPFTGDPGVTRRARIRDSLTLYLNAPRIYSDRHATMYIGCGIHLTILRGMPYVLVNDQIANYYPFLKKVQVRRRIFDYSLYTIDDINDWAHKVSVWVSDRNQQPTFDHTDRKAA